MFLLRAFYLIQMNPLCKLYKTLFNFFSSCFGEATRKLSMKPLSKKKPIHLSIQPCGKNYRTDTEVWLNTEEKLVSVNILCEWNVSQISISTNLVSTKWYHLRINAIFCNRSQDLFKRCIDNVSFRAILGLGSQARFSLNSNVIFIWIIKCKQIVYHQNKIEIIRIQANCCNFFSFV